LSHSANPFFVLGIFEVGSRFLPILVLNLAPPDFCLLSIWDYRREPPAPGLFLFPGSHWAGQRREPGFRADSL
jgi:hypothetical protein